MHDKICRTVFNNYFIFDKRIRLSSIAIITLTRSFSSVKPLVKNPESLALEHINSGKLITFSVINNILLNQNLSVTDSKFKKLLKVKGVELNLPVHTPEDKKLLDELTGISKYKGFSVARGSYTCLYIRVQ